MSVLTPSILASLRSTPQLASSWYYIAAATCSACNRPEEIPVIFRYAIEHDAARTSTTPQTTSVQGTPSSLSQPASPIGSAASFGSEDEVLLVDCSSADPDIVRIIAQKTREALLKSAALYGLPKSINSLIRLRNATPHEFREDRLIRPELPNHEEVQRGTEFWNQVYGKVSRRVLSQMSAAYPDLAHYAIQHVYSPLLSYTGVLSAKETSFVVIACLIPQDVNPQLKGHLKGCLNNGATKEEITSVRNLSMRICRLCGISWKGEVASLS
ncbi:AhpD-like protein [Lipomyces tetrasporus]|uniref:AhpD-like protein n=1 Tax=Lipomyces tetrasporus TaxID=54092 RepID=A0AAD7QTX8_9ASCO|nr:AhpD-like protein [Lipomyces tetrasporus]KAJ8101279.1 AhpD-like protein [Lipomyces tetrasporus]